MATITSKVCDINADHGEAEAVDYGLAGEYFTGDFCSADRDKLAKALEPFLAVGTPVSMKDLAKAGNGVGDFDPTVVRAWALRKGKQVHDRGRVPAELVAEWRADTGNLWLASRLAISSALAVHPLGRLAYRSG
jgi:hypothetical protein